MGEKPGLAYLVVKPGTGWGWVPPTELQDSISSSLGFGLWQGSSLAASALPCSEGAWSSPLQAALWGGNQGRVPPRPVSCPGSMIYHWPAEPALYIEIGWWCYQKNHEIQIIWPVGKRFWICFYYHMSNRKLLLVVTESTWMSVLVCVCVYLPQARRDFFLVQKSSF